MTDTNIGAEDATEASQDTNSTQATEATFTQKDMDDAMAKVKSAVTHKISKQFEGVDVTKYNAMIEAEEKAERKDQLKRGEYEKVIEQQATKFNETISKQTAELTKFKLETPLMEAIAKADLLGQDQVKLLLRDRVKLVDGERVVYDVKGLPMVNNNGQPATLDELVLEFKDLNQHYQRATPSTTNTQTNHNVNVQGELDITKLDIANNPDDRAKYAEHRKKLGYK